MKEEVIIDLKLDTDDGSFRELSSLKSAMVSMKNEQKVLTDAYKKGQITLKEYSSEMVRLDANLKKIGSDYSKLQSQVTGVKSPFAELGAQVKDAASQVNIAGISLATFANPVTATIGILGTLGKAYASSTAGAKDLEFVTNQLSWEFTILSNNINSMLGISSKDGEGVLTKVWNSIGDAWTGGINPVRALSKQLAMAMEELQDLERDELDVLNKRNALYEDNAEILAELKDKQISYSEKILITNRAIANLRDNEKELVAVKQAQLEKMEFMLGFDKENENLQTAVKKQTLEISNVKRDVEKRVQNIIKLETSLLNIERQKTGQAIEQLSKQREKELLARTKAEQKITSDFKKGVKEQTGETNEMLGQNWVDHNKKLRNADLIEMRGYYKEKEKAAEKSAEDEEKRKEKMADFTVALYANQVDTYRQMLAQSNSIGTALLKGFLINMLRMLKSALQARIIGESFATLDSILSFGVTGAIRAAALVGLLEGAFAVAENFISGFAGGGVVSGTKIKPSHGRSVSRSNGDNVLITAKTNEVILNEDQQKALGGDSVFRALGVPGFEPGYATGGKIEKSLMRESSNNAYLRNLMEALSGRQVAVVIEQVELKMQKRAMIREMAEL